MEEFIGRSQLEKLKRTDLVNLCEIHNCPIDCSTNKKSKLIDALVISIEHNKWKYALTLLDSFSTNLANKLVIDGITISNPYSKLTNPPFSKQKILVDSRLKTLKTLHSLQTKGIPMSDSQLEEFDIVKKFHLLYEMKKRDIDKFNEQKKLEHERLMAEQKQREQYNVKRIAIEKRNEVLEELHTIDTELTARRQEKDVLYKQLNKFIEEKKRELGITEIDNELHALNDKLDTTCLQKSACPNQHTFQTKPNFKHGKYRWTNQYCSMCECWYIRPI